MNAIAPITTADLDASFDDEPRILDLRVAERLGYSRTRDIRQLVERNQGELETYGSLAARHRKSRGQEFTEYRLNEPQIILICMFSKTPDAAAVRREVIEVYLAYRRGKLTPANDDTLDEIADRAAAQVIGRHLRERNSAPLSLREKRLLVAECRKVNGPRAAQAMWKELGLPGAGPDQLALLAPTFTEPPFCTGCAARRLWEKPHPTYAENGLDPAEYHPLADGPITGNELATLVILRGRR